MPTLPLSTDNLVQTHVLPCGTQMLGSCTKSHHHACWAQSDLPWRSIQPFARAVELSGRPQALTSASWLPSPWNVSQYIGFCWSYLEDSGHFECKGLLIALAWRELPSESDTSPLHHRLKKPENASPTHALLGISQRESCSIPLLPRGCSKRLRHHQCTLWLDSSMIW